MTRRSAQLRFAAVAFGAAIFAVAVLALAGPSAHAFTMETLSTGGNSTRFADPDERSRNFGQGAQPFGQNGPIVQFGAGQAPYRPFAPRGGYAPLAPMTGGNN